MKKTSLFSAVMSIFLLFSCQNENSQGNSSIVSKTEQDNWQTAKLDAKFANSQKQVTAYLFASDEMSKLVQTPNVEYGQFVLGYSDNTLQIKVIGVNKSGKELASVDSKILKETSYKDELSTLKVSNRKTSKNIPLLDKHLLLPSDAFNGIDKWKQKLNTVSDLDEITSYEGKRFIYYSLEAAIITDILQNKNTTNIGLFLGLNSIGKVTTILIGLDKNNSIKKETSLTGKEALSEDVYDATRPCPPNGDPEPTDI
jgi:hypothetical protein